MKQITLAILAAATLISCTRTVYVPQTSYRSVTDTLLMTTTDSAAVEALFECDSLGRVVMTELMETKGELARQQALFSQGRLKVETRWQTKYIDRIIETRDTVTVVEIKEITKEINRVPKFFWGCAIFTLAACGFGAMKLIRGLRP